MLGLDSPFAPDRENRSLFRPAGLLAPAMTTLGRRPQASLAGWRG